MSDIADIIFFVDDRSRKDANSCWYFCSITGIVHYYRVLYLAGEGCAVLCRLSVQGCLRINNLFPGLVSIEYAGKR